MSTSSSVVSSSNKTEDDEILSDCSTQVITNHASSKSIYNNTISQHIDNELLQQTRKVLRDRVNKFTTQHHQQQGGTGGGSYNTNNSKFYSCGVVLPSSDHGRQLVNNCIADSTDIIPRTTTTNNKNMEQENQNHHYQLQQKLLTTIPEITRSSSNSQILDSSIDGGRYEKERNTNNDADKNPEKKMMTTTVAKPSSLSSSSNQQKQQKQKQQKQKEPQKTPQEEEEHKALGTTTTAKPTATKRSGLSAPSNPTNVSEETRYEVILMERNLPSIKNDLQEKFKSDLRQMGFGSNLLSDDCKSDTHDGPVEPTSTINTMATTAGTTNTSSKHHEPLFAKSTDIFSAYNNRTTKSGDELFDPQLKKQDGLRLTNTTAGRDNMFPNNKVKSMDNNYNNNEDVNSSSSTDISSVNLNTPSRCVDSVQQNAVGSLLPPMMPINKEPLDDDDQLLLLPPSPPPPPPYPLISSSTTKVPPPERSQPPPPADVVDVEDDLLPLPPSEVKRITRPASSSSFESGAVLGQTSNTTNTSMSSANNPMVAQSGSTENNSVDAGCLFHDNENDSNSRYMNHHHNHHDQQQQYRNKSIKKQKKEEYHPNTKENFDDEYYNNPHQMQQQHDQLLRNETSSPISDLWGVVKSKVKKQLKKQLKKHELADTKQTPPSFEHQQQYYGSYHDGDGNDNDNDNDNEEYDNAYNEEYNDFVTEEDEEVLFTEGHHNQQQQQRSQRETNIIFTTTTTSVLSAPSSTSGSSDCSTSSGSGDAMEGANKFHKKSSNAKVQYESSVEVVSRRVVPEPPQILIEEEEDDMYEEYDDIEVSKGNMDMQTNGYRHDDDEEEEEDLKDLIIDYIKYNYSYYCPKGSKRRLRFKMILGLTAFILFLIVVIRLSKRAKNNFPGMSNTNLDTASTSTTTTTTDGNTGSGVEPFSVDNDVVDDHEVAPLVCEHWVGIDQVCQGDSMFIFVSFINCDAYYNDWIGIYNVEDDPTNLGEPLLWEWTCGANGQACEETTYDHMSIFDTSTSIQIQEEGNDNAQYIAYLIKSDPEADGISPPYEATSISPTFQIQQSKCL